MIHRPSASRPTRRLPKPARALVGLGAALVAVVAFGAGCVPNAKQDSLRPEGHYAQTIYNLVVPVFIVGGIVSVIVIGGTLWFAWRYRATGDETDDENIPEPIHGNTAMELGWTITPAVVLLVIGFATVVTIFKLDQQPPPENPHIEVIGQQWWWEFRYDLGGAGTEESDRTYDDIVTANDMVIPADTDISLKMTARDVIHGWWVPTLNGKRDVVPGRVTMFNVAADEPGTYYGQCTVMCGLSHANMLFTVTVLPQDEYQTWLEEQVKPAVEPTTGLAAEGAALFKTQCGQCHTVRGIHQAPGPDDEANPLTAGAAPDLTHFMSRPTFASGMFDLRIPSDRCVAKGLYFAEDESCINTAELRSWLHDPTAMLPMAAEESDIEINQVRGMPDMGLSPAALDQLIAFLETLK